MKIQVIVKPSSRRPQVEVLESGDFRVSVKAPPIEGRANEEVVEALAEHFKIPKRSVRLIAGAKGKQKRFEIDLPPIKKSK